MEYYGLRKAGDDIDLIVTEEDLTALIKLYPTRVKDIWGDFGVCPENFEIWKTIRYHGYDFYREGAVEEDTYFVVSLEKLLFMKALAMRIDKYLQDTYLISDEINKKNGELTQSITASNKKILDSVGPIEYIEHSGPQE